MSFLANKLKLEVKSTNRSRLARFSSVQNKAEIHFVANDTSNYAGVLGASRNTNIDAYIALISDNINTKVLSFDSNSINFGNDTLLKGNLVVLGTVYTIASDVLTEENTFILNNYGTSAERGLNSVSQQSLTYLYAHAPYTSNILTTHTKSEFERLKIALNIDSVSGLLNNNFTEADFNTLFASSTLDDISQGTSNRFIVDDEYTPHNAGNPLIVTGKVIADNITTTDMYVDDIYAEYFYGDGSSITNVNTTLFNTNGIIENAVASNLYFTPRRAGSFIFASNVNVSNYADNLQLQFQGIQNVENTNLSNYVVATSNNLLASFDINKNDFMQLLHNTCNAIIYDIENKAYTEHSAILANSGRLSDYYRQTIADASNMINDTSNNTLEYINLQSGLTYIYAQGTSNNLYIDLSVFDQRSRLDMTISSNFIEHVLSTCNINISNLIADVQRNLFAFTQQSYDNALSTSTADYNTLFAHLQTHMTAVDEYLVSQSNISIDNTEAQFESVNLYLQSTSNDAAIYIDESIQNISNYISLTSNQLAFQIMTEMPIYIIDMSELMHFKFEQNALLADSSDNNVLLTNFGGAYANNNDRNSLYLASGSYAQIQSTDWSLYSDLSISFWLNTNGMSSGDKLLEFNYLDIVTDQLQAWFNFEGNFNSANNYSLTPSVSSSPSFDMTNKKIGSYSASFTSLSQFLQSSDIDLTNKSFSISFWIYLKNATSSSEWWIVSQGGVPAIREVLHIALDDQRFKFSFWNDDLYTSVFDLSDINDVWNHLVLVYDKENDRSMKIYINNMLVASKNAGGDTFFAPNTFRIGKSVNYGNAFIGNIDDFKVYHKALDTNEINKLYDVTAQLKNIKILHVDNELQFVVDELFLYSTAYNTNSWNYVLWNITNSYSARGFINVNGSKTYFDELQLTSGMYVNTLGSMMGNLYVSDFRVLNVPLSEAIEAELYSPTSTLDLINNYEDINIAVTDTTMFTTAIYDGFKEYSNVAFTSITNNIQHTSNVISTSINVFVEVQADSKETLIASLDETLNGSVTNLTADDIPETVENIYYLEERFTASFNTRTLDNIPVRVSGSNSVVVNNVYNSNLNVYGNLTAYNVSVFGDKATFNTTVYNTELVQVENYSNTTAMQLKNYVSSTADIITLANNTGAVFHLQNDGKMGVKKTPEEKLDVAGDVHAEYLFGSGMFLYNVNLTTMTTADLQESVRASNLYFTAPRVSAILVTSNILTSNYVRNQSNFLDVFMRTEDKNVSNLIDNVSNIHILNPIVLSSNYVRETSNELFNFMFSTGSNQSNYVINMSNYMLSYISNMYVIGDVNNQSNYVRTTSNFIHTAINYSNYVLSNYLLDVSNMREGAYKDVQSLQSNYMRDTSNILAGRITDLSINHSNLVAGFSNLFALSMTGIGTSGTNNFSNVVSSVSNDLQQSILVSFARNQSNYIDGVGTRIINYTSATVADLTANFKTDDTIPYNYAVDSNIIHMNFRDKKILNGLNTNLYRMTSNTCNFTNIYPVINNVTRFNDMANYLSTNEWTFPSTSNMFLTLTDQYSIKKTMNSLNGNIFSIHFVFNTISALHTPVYYLGNNSRLYLSIKILYGALFIIVGNGVGGSILNFYVSSTPILTNTWYITDIICDSKGIAGNVSVDVYLNAVKQTVHIQNVITPFNMLENLGNITGAYNNNLMYTSSFTSFDTYSNYYAVYQFSPTDLTADSSVNGRILTNNGGTYAFDTRHSISLSSGQDATIPSANWGAYGDLTISGWFKTSGFVNSDKIMNFSFTSTTILKYPRFAATANTYTYSDSTQVRISASSTSWSKGPYTAFDNITNDAWVDGGNYGAGGLANRTLKTDYAGEYLQIDLGESIILISYTLYNTSGTTSANGAPKTFRIYASNDINCWTNINHSSWMMIDERTDLVYSGVRSFNINNNTTPYRFYVIIIKNNYGNEGWVQISEWELYANRFLNMAIINTNNFLSFQINTTPIYETSYNLNNTWNHIVWNIANTTSTLGYVRINNGTRQTYTKVVLTSATYTNKLGATTNTGSLNIADFRILLADKSNEVLESELYFNRPYHNMFVGANNNYDAVPYDFRQYTAGATYTNTYWSSNSYIMPNVLSPIIRSSVHNYASFSNLIFASYYASNFDYQYSSNISATQIINNDFTDNGDTTRLIIGDRTPLSSYFNFVLTEVEANVRLNTGYYHFLLDLQNEVSADLLIGKHIDNSIDEYINVANYYNSNLLNEPLADINHNSNMVLTYPLFMSEGNYRFYLRMLRTFANRNNRYFMPKFYYNPTWNGLSYSVNDSNLFLRYMRASELSSLGYTGGLNNVNRLLNLNNTVTGASSNLYVYSRFYTDNRSYACGYNAYGQLGINSTTQSTILVPVRDTTGNAGTAITNISQVSAGSDYSLFLEKTTGKVYACGRNGNGQLGINSITQSIILVPVRDTTGNDGTTITNISQVSAGGNSHSLFLEKDTGKVYACGNNGLGQLGINSTTITQSTILVPVRDITGNDGTTITNISQVSAGANHSLFLEKTTGKVYACGFNVDGQLGINSTTRSTILVPVRDITGNDGTTITNISQVSAGAGHSLFLEKTTGKVYACGYNFYGQLGINSTTFSRILVPVRDTTGNVAITNISQVSAGGDYSLFLEKDTGKVYACGENSSGQLGINSITQSIILVPVRDTTGNAGTTITNISQVSASCYANSGSYYSLFLEKDTGKVYACGANNFGQLGINSTTQSTKLVPVRDTTGNAETTITNISQVSAGTNHSLFIANIPTYTITNVSNYTYNIPHSNIPNSFFANFSSNNIRLQDFRVYTKDTKADIIDNIQNVLYYGNNTPTYSYTNNIIVKPVRWLESTDYSCNYFGEFNRYISYNETGDIGVSIGKSSASTATLDIYTDDPTLYSIKTNNPIWVSTAVLASSDERIKNNIRDFYEDEALQQILAIQPKTYNYLDHNRVSETVIGFSAQQIKEVIPNAVSLHTEAIPNIHIYAYIHNSSVYLEDPTDKLSVGATVVIEYNNRRYYERVTEVSNNLVFNIENKSALPNSSVHVYGTIVDDFHSLDKNYIYTLSVCATQALYKKQEELNTSISTFINDLQCNPAFATYTSDIQAFASNIYNAQSNAEQMSSNINDTYNTNALLLEELSGIQTYLESLQLQQGTPQITYLNDLIISLQDYNSNLIIQNEELLSNSSLYSSSVNNLEQNINNINDILQRNNLQ